MGKYEYKRHHVRFGYDEGNETAPVVLVVEEIPGIRVLHIHLTLKESDRLVEEIFRAQSLAEVKDG